MKRKTNVIPFSMKILPGGIAVLKNDSHISAWVEESGRLDHDQYALPIILQYISEGDTVVDVGAFIGDHTIAYENAVGKSGVVMAFEPNPDAFACLKRNCHHAIKFNIGLSDHHHDGSMTTHENAGKCRVSADIEGTSLARLAPLDQWNLVRLNFLKIDVEGFEIRVLRGAEKTIRRHKPIMWIEVNKSALNDQGTSPSELLAWIHHLGYSTTPYPEEGDQYDVLCEAR
jgi:FkbM family methyltransferase